MNIIVKSERERNSNGCYFVHILNVYALQQVVLSAHTNAHRHKCTGIRFCCWCVLVLSTDPWK